VPPEPRLQVFFDLLAELIKFNPPVLLLVERVILCVSTDDGISAEGRRRAALLRERMQEHIIDSSILLQGVILTLHPHISPLRGHPSLFELMDHEEAAGQQGVHQTGSSWASEVDAVAAEVGLEEGPHASSLTLAHEVGEEPISRALASSAVRSALATVGVRSPPPPLVAPCSHGPMGSFVREHRVQLCLRLMNAVSLPEVSVETMCVINAVIVIFMVAKSGENVSDGHLTLMHLVWEEAARKEKGEANGSEATKDAAGVTNADRPAENRAARTTTEEAATANIVGLPRHEEAVVPCSECETCASRRLTRFKSVDAASERSATTPGSASTTVSVTVPAVLDNFVNLLGFWGNVYETHSCERRFLEFSSGIPFAHWLLAVRDLKCNLVRPPPQPPPLPPLPQLLEERCEQCGAPADDC